MFRSLKFHTLSALALASLMPIAAIAATGSTSATKTPARTVAHHTVAPTKAKSVEAGSHKKHMAARHATLNLNTASKEELTSLPGITDEMAQKIIDNRPYKSKAELASKQVITKAEYSKIKGRVTAKQAPTMKSEGEKAPESSNTTETKAPETKAPETQTPSETNAQEGSSGSN